MLGLLAGTASRRLAKRGLLLFLDRNQQTGSRLGVRQDLRHGLFHLGPLAEPGARALEAFPQVAKRFGRPLDRPRPARGILLGLARAVVPQQPIAFRMNVIVPAA
jgi:hypothetical protein